MSLFFVCVKIFFARILDVTISTIRQNFMLKEHYVLSTILAFFEIFIWFIVAREALLISIDSVLIPISYSLGYATGTLIGSLVSKRLIKGVVGVQIILKKDNEKLINSLKMRGYRINMLSMHSAYNSVPRVMLFVEVNSKSVEKLEKLVLQYDSSAFVADSEKKRVLNGTLK